MADSRALTFFVVAGEESGDLHGSRLMRSLKKIHPSSRFIGHGGNRMKGEGLQILRHVDSLSMMGFSEVLKHLPFMIKVMGETVKAIEKLRPDRVILIDYPGFNLRLAKRLKMSYIPITYFILPQVWAWKEKRVEILKKYVNQSLCIFPFEQKWFEDRGVSVHYPGHPFSEQYFPEETKEAFFLRHNFEKSDPLLVLLPGSRQQEVDRHWSVFLKSVEFIKAENPNIQFCVAKSPAVTLNPIPSFIRTENKLTKCSILYADAALSSSGTATLECAVHDTPVVVCYRMSWFSWQIIKHLTNVPFASMVNLIAGKKIVPEFLQTAMKPKLIAGSVLNLFNRSGERKNMLLQFEAVRRSLGLPGVYDRAAEAVLNKHF